MNWQFLLGERGSCRRGALKCRNKHLKGCVALGSFRTQVASRNHPPRSCFDPRVRHPLSTAGHTRSRINRTILPGMQSIPMRVFNHRSCLSGDHHDDPTIHIHHNTTPLSHHSHLCLSRNQLLNIRGTDTQQWRRRPTHVPSNPRASPTNSAQRLLRRRTDRNHRGIWAIIRTPTDNRPRRHTNNHGRSRHSNSRHNPHNRQPPRS